MQAQREPGTRVPATSRPATAGRADRLRPRGAGRDDGSEPTTKRRVRGPLHRANARSPSPAFRLRAPRFGELKPAVARRASEGGSRGRMQYDPGLARAFRARVMSNSDVEPPATCSPDERSDIRVRTSGLLCRSRISLRSSGLRNFLYGSLPARKKGSGTPADAVFHGPHTTACGARHGEGGLRRPSAIGRARLLAFHSRHLRQRPNATAQLQFTHFLGRNY